ncbi:hypothetical protein E2C01_097787 [Portunus trituberculatus]|uniref:Uncharacterized protein n=1 Tax=Portunus trituberculatus TaxID=210409 RepID=A0A5B7K5A7_PORTR|nr:hypothetical protein [Portunus trituberculatus]
MMTRTMMAVVVTYMRHYYRADGKVFQAMTMAVMTIAVITAMRYFLGRDEVKDGNFKQLAV